LTASPLDSFGRLVMPRPAQLRSLPLPRGWPRRVRSAVVHLISLAPISLALIRAGQNAAPNFGGPLQPATVSY